MTTHTYAPTRSGKCDICTRPENVPTHTKRTIALECDARTKSGAACSRNASATIPASAFTAELHFCKTHSEQYIREAVATMAAWTR